MKLKSFIFAFLLVASGYGLANAAQPTFQIPLSVDNTRDTGGAWSGVETVFLSTCVVPILVTDSDSATITDGFIHWIICGSTTDVESGGGLYIEIRSTDTANTTTARLIPRIYVTENATGVTNRGQFIQFRPPIPFENGLSINMGPTGSDPGSIEFAVGVGWKRQ